MASNTLPTGSQNHSAEVMVTAVEKLGVDAAIIFSDLLPILEPKRPAYTELDARNTQAPPRFEVTAPTGAPNVVIVLLDDMGFGAPSVDEPAHERAGQWLVDRELQRSLRRGEPSQIFVRHGGEDLATVR